MSCERYLIVGLARTGTTAVATTVRNTLKVRKLLMEPEDFATIEQVSADERLVIKIIFEHWRTRTDGLKALVCPTVGDHTPTTIAIVRDPRDEAVSRLHYLAYDYFSTRPSTEDDRAAWIEIFRRKEETPDSVSLIDMQSQIINRFGNGFLAPKAVYEAYCQFIDDILGAPTVHLLRYEDFINNTIASAPLCAILSGNRNVDSSYRRVFRSGSSGAWRHFLTDSDVAVINETCEPFLRRFNYPFKRVRTLEKPSRATGSGYVEKLIDEARGQFREPSI